MRSGSGRVLGEVPNGPARRPRAGERHRPARMAAPGDPRRPRRSAGIPIHLRRPPRVDRGDADAPCARASRTEASPRATSSSAPTASTRSPGAGSTPPPPHPRYSGLVGTGGIARIDGLEPTPDAQHFVFGARSFFGYLVRDDGTAYWFANLTKPEPPRGSLAGDRRCGVAARAAGPALGRPEPGARDPRRHPRRAARLPDLRPRRRPLLEPRARRRGR